MLRPNERDLKRPLAVALKDIPEALIDKSFIEELGREGFFKKKL